MQGKKQVVLDWSRLLGFDQASERNPAAPQISDARLGKLGSKVGSKGCTVRRDAGAAGLRSAIGAKVGSKPVVHARLARVGAKVGFKTSKA
jgi:hypothetical protein